MSLNCPYSFLVCPGFLISFSLSQWNHLSFLSFTEIQQLYVWLAGIVWQTAQKQAVCLLIFGETLHLQHLKVLRLLLFYELDVELPWQLINTTSDGYSNSTVLCYCSQHLGSNQSDESNKQYPHFLHTVDDHTAKSRLMRNLCNLE